MTLSNNSLSSTLVLLRTSFSFQALPSDLFLSIDLILFLKSHIFYHLATNSRGDKSIIELANHIQFLETCCLLCITIGHQSTEMSEKVNLGDFSFLNRGEILRFYCPSGCC